MAYGKTSEVLLKSIRYMPSKVLAFANT